MKLFSSKKRVAAIGALTAATLLGGGMAYGYWTTTGTGTGSADVGTAASWIVGEVGTPSGDPLVPDAAIGSGTIQTHSYEVENDATGPQMLTGVAISVADLNGDPWSTQTDPGQPACTEGDFSIGGALVGVAYTDTDSAGTFAAPEVKSDTVTVQMIDNGLNQDNCKLVSVPLYFEAS